MITVNHLLILQNAGAGLWPASLLCCWKHAHRYLVPWISETTRLNRPHVRTRAASTMHYFISKGAAALLALASFAMAVGTAHIVNNCGFPIYYASVGQSQHAEMQELQGSYSESYTQPGVGISIKLSPSMNGPVSQFEFTWADGKNLLRSLQHRRLPVRGCWHDACSFHDRRWQQPNLPGGRLPCWPSRMLGCVQQP